MSSPMNTSVSLDGNDSLNLDPSLVPSLEPPLVTELAFGLVLSSTLNICVIIGNLLTLSCLIIDRHLRRNRTNYFVGSLALADLALGLFVLPPFIAAQWMQRWPFGVTACRIWLSVDVWLYTASIYSLIAVAVDRYWAITRPLRHKSLTTHGRAISMIVWAWSLSFAIALPSMFFEAPLAHGQCALMLHSYVYIIYSSIGSFYLPMIVLLFLYVNIYRTIRKVKLNGTNGIVQTMDVSASTILRRCLSDHPDLAGGGGGPFGRKRNGSDETTASGASAMDSYKRQLSAGLLRIHRGQYHKPIVGRDPSCSPPVSPIGSGEQSRGSLEVTALLQKRPRHHPEHHHHHHGRLYETVGHFLAKKHMTARNYRNKLLVEFRAVRMIAMITTSFFLCWAGFSILCTLNAFAYRMDTAADDPSSTARSRAPVPNWLIDWLTWLAYVNSAVDPLVYAVSNRRFRRTFKRVLRMEFACCYF